MFTAVIPGRLRRLVGPKPSATGPSFILGGFVQLAVCRYLILAVRRIVPSHTCTDLLKTRIPPVHSNGTNDAAVPVLLVPFHFYGPAHDKKGKMCLGAIAEWLPLLGCVDAGNTYLVLYAFGV